MSTPITDYILQFPPEVQAKLNQMRDAILEIAPDATEKIAYGIPTFYLKGNMVHFAAYQNHIGFYPGADGIAAFTDELSRFKLSKGHGAVPAGSAPAAGTGAPHHALPKRAEPREEITPS